MTLSQLDLLELMTDGDLLALVREMGARRGDGAVSITEVKGHADEETVQIGQVREVNRTGNDKADEAPDFWS